MKLYKLQLFKRYLDYIQVEEALLQMYHQSTNPFMQNSALDRIRVREREIRESGAKGWRETLEREYVNLTKQEIPRQKAQLPGLPDAYIWKVTDEEPLKLLPQNYIVIKSFMRFYKHDCYGYKGSFRCKPCDEKVQGYLITQGADEETGKGGKIIVSFCFTCENKYFQQGEMDKYIKSIVSFAYRALNKEKVRVRQRGGARLTMDEQNGLDTETQQNRYSTRELDGYMRYSPIGIANYDGWNETEES